MPGIPAEIDEKTEDYHIQRAIQAVAKGYDIRLKFLPKNVCFSYISGLYQPELSTFLVRLTPSSGELS
jgi:hypothetical protein